MFTAALLASVLIAGLWSIGFDGALALGRDPKPLRYRILSVAARLVGGGHKRRLQIAVTWPWAASHSAGRTKIEARAWLPGLSVPDWYVEVALQTVN